MSLDELLKGLSVFKSGMQEFAQNKVIQEANTELQDLNSQQMDLNEKLQAQSQISNNLQLRLSQAGADASKIGAATKGLGISAGQQFQQLENIRAQEARQKFEIEAREDTQAAEFEKQRRQFAQQKAMQGLKEQATKTKEGEKRKKNTITLFRGLNKDFRKNNQDLFSTLQLANRGETLIEKAQTDPGSIGSIQGLLDTSIAGAVESGKLTDEDIERARTLKAATDKLAQKGVQNFTGQDTKEYLRQAKELLNTLKGGAVSGVVGNAVTNANAQAAVVGDFDEKAFTNLILADSGIQLDEKSFKAAKEKFLSQRTSAGRLAVGVPQPTTRTASEIGGIREPDQKKKDLLKRLKDVRGRLDAQAAAGTPASIQDLEKLDAAIKRLESR